MTTLKPEVSAFPMAAVCNIEERNICEFTSLAHPGLHLDLDSGAAVQHSLHR